MLSKKMEDAINKQINAELYSAYFYLSMAAYYESVSLPGFANWMKVQAQEEVSHAMLMFDYVNDRGGRAIMAPIDGPPTEWGSVLAPLEDTYKHEQKVTGLINGLVDIALSERDHATTAMLQWFVTEQVEEEKNASDLVEKIKRIGDSPNALFMLDRELTQRVFVPPAAGGSA